MNINSLDLNLLVAFVAIDRERNITLAADRVGLSQPALSNALARLRKILNDPLFVRTVRGMEPTPYAASIAEPIRKACELIDGALKIDASFDAARSSRTFSVFMTDIGEAVMMPRLLRHLQTIAPNVGINIESIPRRGIQESMISGDVDLAVGLFEGLSGGFFEELLYRDEFVCIANTEHPTVKDTLSLQQFSTLPHVVVSSSGTAHEVGIERTIAKQRIKRPVAMTGWGSPGRTGADPGRAIARVFPPTPQTPSSSNRRSSCRRSTSSSIGTSAIITTPPTGGCEASFSNCSSVASRRRLSAPHQEVNIYFFEYAVPDSQARRSPARDQRGAARIWCRTNNCRNNGGPRHAARYRERPTDGRNENSVLS